MIVFGNYHQWQLQKIVWYPKVSPIGCVSDSIDQGRLWKKGLAMNNASVDMQPYLWDFLDDLDVVSHE